jgi:Protein of unknown function (DUF1552)
MAGIALPRTLSRRTMLKGLGVALALPFLDAMTPVLSAAEPRAKAIPRRMLCIETNQGILPQHFFPKTAGSDYDSTPYLDILKDHRAQMTVLSGVSLPEVDGGHHAELCFLTGAGHPGRGGFRNAISLDQFAAERVGLLTRHPSLSLSVDTRNSLSFTGAGVMIPGEDKPSQLFKRLFIQGTPAEVEAQVARLREERSILDQVAERSKQLQSKIGAADRDKVDQYFTSLRELERRLTVAEEWERKPKPKTDAKGPQDNNDRSAVIERTRTMYELARLALASDSTRIITLYISQDFVRPNIQGVNEGTHQLTHHGNQPEKLAMLRLIEEAQFRELATLLKGLSETKEPHGSLLDTTTVLYGTNMGSANAHSNDNLPVLVAGGGFKHGSHLAFDRAKNYPLTNLYVSMLQRLGIEADTFSSGTSTMRGLEMT